MNTELIEATARRAAQWWADRLEQGDKALFVERLSELVRGDLEARGHCDLSCDYDPQDYLLDAVRYAGVDCEGNFFSARGVLPAKHSTWIEAGLIEPKEGYGNWTEAIVVTPNNTTYEESVISDTVMIPLPNGGIGLATGRYRFVDKLTPSNTAQTDEPG